MADEKLLAYFAGVIDGYEQTAEEYAAQYSEDGRIVSSAPASDLAESFTVEYGVQPKDAPEKDWDQVDTGTQWSTRYGRPYTKEEAEIMAKNNVREARVVHRFVSRWLP